MSEDKLSKFKTKLTEEDVKALDEALHDHIIIVIRLYHDARLKSKECPDLVLENRDDVAAERMRTLYDLEDQLFIAADYLEDDIGKAIIKYREVKEDLTSHPDIYKSFGGKRDVIVKLFNKMYDRESEMFKLAGIDYHECKS